MDSQDKPVKNEDAEKLIERTALQLYEMGFDSVQILATWMEGGHTKSIKKGSGNWYARQHLAAEFQQEDISQDQAVRIAQQLDKPDGDDSWKMETTG